MTHPPAGGPATGPARDEARQLLDALAVVFHDEANYGPSLTAAAGGMTLLSGFLSTCLGHAQPAAIPTQAQLAETILALHITSHQLATGLNHTVDALERRRLRAVNPVGAAEAQAVRVALYQAGTGLLTAAVGFGAAHQLLDEADDASDPSARRT